jgi:hypothetical protein
MVARSLTTFRCWGLVAGMTFLLAHTQAQADEALLPAPAHEIRALALTGQPAPDGFGTIAGLGTAAPVLDQSGEVLFVADIHAAEVDIDAHAVLRSGPAGALLQVLRTGEPLPGGATFGWLRNGQDICLSESGQVAVYVPVDAQDAVLNAIHQADRDGGIEQVFEADRHRGLSAGFILGEDGSVEIGPDLSTRPVYNARGEVAFLADRALHLASPDGTLHTVVRAGDELEGGQVVDVLFAGDESCRRGFNDSGQITFYARMVAGDGVSEGIFLATPY